MRVPASELRHDRHRLSRVRQSDVLAKFEQAQNRSFLFLRSQLFEWPGQVTARADDSGTARAVVPVRRREQRWPAPTSVEPDKQLLDQQPVVQEDDELARHAALLVYEIRVFERSDAEFVAVRKDTPQFAPSCADATRDDERCVAEVDEAHLTAATDAPSMPKFGWQARLASVRHLGIARRSHERIVHGDDLQGTRICLIAAIGLPVRSQERQVQDRDKHQAGARRSHVIDETVERFIPEVPPIRR